MKTYLSSDFNYAHEIVGLRKEAKAYRLARSCTDGAIEKRHFDRLATYYDKLADHLEGK